MINRWVLLFGDKTVTLHVHIQLVKKQSQVGTFLIKLTFIPVKVTLCNLMVLLECPVNEQITRVIEVRISMLSSVVYAGMMVLSITGKLYIITSAGYVIYM